MLQAFGSEGWKSLKRTTRLRLETAISADILNGRYDVHGPFANTAGLLGRFARTFYRRFTQPENVIDNIVSQLRPDWYSQNYIGMHFIPFIADIKPSSQDRARLIKAIASGMYNDPHVLKSRLAKLPQDWRDDINAAK